jgi:hypothetical protein
MGGGRQAWCPRCDELRAARAGGPCPVCGREPLAVPTTRPGQPRPGPADRAARRLKALAPAAGALGAGLLALAVVASGFTAGWLTRTTPSAPAAAPSSTVAGFIDEGPETGRRDFNWAARDGGLTVELRNLTVGTGFSRLELRVQGVRRGREVSALERLRIRDRDGHDLLAGGEIPRIATAGSRPADGGGIDTEVVLDRPIDLQAVASVELGGLTVGRAVSERVDGTLVDAELRRRAPNSFDDTEWLTARASCPKCQLRVVCEDCDTLRVVGSTYRRGRVLIAVESLDRPELSALNPSRRRVRITDASGYWELPAWIDGSGGTAVISVAADQLAAALPGDPGDGEPMAFSVLVEALTEEAVRGAWTIDQAGG